jgi:hypothetical protein
VTFLAQQTAHRHALYKRVVAQALTGSTDEETLRHVGQLEREAEAIDARCETETTTEN